MISDLNEQLQQELEYILLKPDCYSWWISKMQSDTLEVFGMIQPLLYIYIYIYIV